MDGNLEESMEDIRKKIQSIEWDMRLGFFNKRKIPYYKRLLQEYEELKNSAERF